MLSFYLSLLETPQARAEFERVYTVYCQKLYRIAFSMLRSQSQAEDAVHDTFVKLISHFDSFSSMPCKKQDTWIVIVLKNTCLDMLRRQKKQLPPEMEDVLLNLPDPTQDVEADVRFRLLRSAMKQLSPEDRELLELKLVLEWSDKEIASSLGITANAAGVRIHRAKIRLKRLLEQEGWL